MEKDERQALFIYERGKSIMNSAVTKQEYLEAVSYFAQISDFNDSADLMSECIRLSENAEKDEVYNKAIDTMRGDSIEDYRRSLWLFDSIPDWRDSAQMAQLCRQTIEGRIANQEKKKRRIRIIIISAVSVVLIAIIATVVIVDVVLSSKYDRAEKYYESEKYAKAYKLYDELDGFNDSDEKIEKIKAEGKKLARNMADKGEYKKAYDLLVGIGMSSKEYSLMSAYKSAMNGDYKSAVKSGLTEIIIPEGVTSIKSDEFRDCTELKKITLPSSLERISDGAFYGCVELQRVVFAEGCQLKSIGVSAFQNCSALKEITITSKVTTIGKNAFTGCTSLKTANFKFTGNWKITVEGEKIKFESSEIADSKLAAEILTDIVSEFSLTR